MTNIDDPQVVARFLVGVGYTREQITEALLRRFPNANADELIDEAARKAEESNQEIDQQLAEEARRAIAAEHDLNRSNTDG